jgi:hypothetical protein
VAWHSYGQDVYGYGVFGQRYDREGDRVGDEFILDGQRQFGEQQHPALAATPGGFVAVWQGNAPSNGGNGDGSGWGIFGKRIELPDVVAPVGGETQVNSKVAHAQSFPSTATLTNAAGAELGYVVIWRSAPSQGTGDISSNGMFGQRYAADGSKLGGEFTVNTNTVGDQDGASVAALGGGAGFVVVWHSATGDGSSYGIYGQRFDNAGAKVGSEFLVNSVASGKQSSPDVSALKGDNTGGFVVVWQQDDHNVEGRVFNAAGLAVGDEFSVNVQRRPLNLSDSTEIEADVTATADGGFVVVWEDHDGDGSASGVFGQRYSAPGGVATRLGGVNADGSTSPDNFRLNASDEGSQYEAKVTALDDGGFVALWRSDTGDDYGSGVFMQIYNANGTLRGAQTRVNDTALNYQDGAEATAVAGGFVVAWRSNHMGGLDAYEAVAKRFDFDGVAVSGEIKLNQYTLGDQHQPVVTRLGDGFAATWTSAGQDGSGDGVFTRQFVTDRTPTSGDIADRPNLTAVAARGDEDTAIALTLSASLRDTDGSETLRVEISNIPVGATLSDGVRSFTARPDATAVTLTGWTLSALRIAPAANADADFTLKVRATATEKAGGDFAWNTDEIRVTVNDLAEAQAPFNEEFRANQQTDHGQSQPAIATFANGDFVMVWTSLYQTGGYVYDVMARLFNADGTPKGAEFLVRGGNYHEYEPTVAVLADGGFIVTHTVDHIDYLNVGAQRFDATGAKVTKAGLPPAPGQDSYFLINDYRPGEQREPEIVSLTDGGWVVVWHSHNQEPAGTDTANTWGVFAKRYAADGSVVKMYDADGTPRDEIQVNTTANQNQEFPTVIQLASGGLVFAWHSASQVGSTGNWDITGRVYGADGRPEGADFLLHAADLGWIYSVDANGQQTGVQARASQVFPSLAALEGGGFVATWQGERGDAYGVGIQGQRFNDAGERVGGVFQVNSYAYDTQEAAKVVGLPDGGFLATWSSHGQDGSSWGVYARRFDAEARAVGEEYRVNVPVGGDQSNSAVAVQPGGTGLVFAYEGQDGSGYGIYGKRVPLPEASAPQAVKRAGLETLVNTTKTDSQELAGVTKLADGSYVVVWQSHGQDGSSWGIYATRFDADGDAIQLKDAAGNLLTRTDANGNVLPLTELLINKSTASSPNATDSVQQYPAVVALEDGGFAVAYESHGRSGDGDYGIYVRRFDGDMQEVLLKTATGAQVSELRINAVTAHGQHFPSLVALEDGAFAVAWHSNHQDGESWGVYTRQVDAAGQIVGAADTQVNSIAVDQQYGASIAKVAGGDYVIVWQSHNQDGSSWGVFGQRFNAEGSKDGAEFLINTHTDNDQSWQDVAGLEDGGFVVVWYTSTGADADASSFGIAGQRYDAFGAPVGGEFQINGNARDSQDAPEVVGTPDGGFLVTWVTDSNDGDGKAVVVRRFDADGVAMEPYGNDVRVNTSTVTNQSQPAIAVLDRGFVVVWTSAHDGNNTNIYMQRFEGEGLEPPPFVVDVTTGALDPNDRIFSSLAEVMADADLVDGSAIVLKGGTYDLTAGVIVAKDNLVIRNAAGEQVTINGPTGGAALTINADRNLILRADVAGNLVINGGDGAAATLDFLGGNGGTELDRVTVNAADGQAVRFAGGQNGIIVQESRFGGATIDTLVTVAGTDSGAAASNDVSFEDNTFTSAGGGGLYTEATGGRILDNVFGGTIAAGDAALWLEAGGAEVKRNSFAAQGDGARIYDAAGAYSEAALVGDNSFPDGFVLVDERNGIFSTVAEALALTSPSDRVRVSAGDYAGEGVLLVSDENLRVDGPGTALNLDLALAAGLSRLTLQGSAPVDVTGNALANVLLGNAGANRLTGAGGNDALTGGDGDDDLDGGEGDDTLSGEAGNDDLVGGVGNDTFLYAQGAGTDTVAGGAGSEDRLVLSSANYSTQDAVTLSGVSGGFLASFAGRPGGVTSSGVELVDLQLDYGDDVTLTGALTGVRGVLIRGGHEANTVDASALSPRPSCRSPAARARTPSSAARVDRTPSTTRWRPAPAEPS